MKSQRLPLGAGLLAVVLAVIVYSGFPAAQTAGRAEHFSAMAVDMNTGQTGRIEMSVTRWSTSAEREKLLSVLFQEGSDELLSTLRDMKPVGRIYTPGSIGFELKFAEQQTLPEGGRRVVLAGDRPMSFYELMNRPRSADYPFTWIQLNLTPEGTGEGRLALAARVYGDSPKRPIEVENFDIQPIRLNQLTSRKGN